MDLKRFLLCSVALILLIAATSVPLLNISAFASSNCEKLLALTFDDGPSKYTDTLLEGLAERGIHATFFMQGCNAETYPDTVKRAYEEGHQIANHTYNHPALTSLSVSSIQNQISQTEGILDRAIGYDLNYMVRPPYGSYNATVLSAVGNPCFFWTIDPMDWYYLDETVVYDNILANADDGSIILVHDLYPTSVAAALDAVDTLQSQGYEFVTINELFRRRGITLDEGCIYFSGIGETTLPSISTPIVQPTNVENGKLVSLSEANGAPVYYTTDGSDPTPNSIRYTEPLYFTEETTVKAISAYDFNGSRSAITTETISVPQAAAPELSLSDRLLSMSAKEGAVIYYTTDGSDPTSGGTMYTTPFPVTSGTTYRAVAQVPGESTSEVVQLTTPKLPSISDTMTMDWCYPSVVIPLVLLLRHLHIYVEP
jgi:peptidoglycan/xylan/chitin deacetylase (PgdA/CDA1 family)